jgi:hypothetical protein
MFTEVGASRIKDSRIGNIMMIESYRGERLHNIVPNEANPLQRPAHDAEGNVDTGPENRIKETRLWPKATIKDVKVDVS